MRARESVTALAPSPSPDHADAAHSRNDDRHRVAGDWIEHLFNDTDDRDHDTWEHTERVGIVAAQLAERLGMAREDVRSIQRAAALHDVGKVGIPDAILLKPTTLSEAEMAVMRTHAAIGAEILRAGDTPLLRLAAQIAITHHERWDGAGYPNRLAGEAIPLPGRIVAVADAFDALTNDRPYRQACSVDEAMEEIARGAGTQFDPRVVEALVRVVAAGVRNQRAGRGQSPAAGSRSSRCAMAT